MITRLAPTPSGFMHQGNIFNFLLNWLWARSNGGKVLLRIDDMDAARSRDEYIEDIFRILDWLELDWDIGPSGPYDFGKNWSQTSRQAIYENILQELEGKKLVYACECSRMVLANTLCHCEEKILSLSTPELAWRIKKNANCLVSFPDRVAGNVTIDIKNESAALIVKRKDGFPSYQVASLADDRHFAVTHICRGQDLLSSTAVQLYIDSQLAIPYFQNCHFWHHSLITNDGNKLSKSAGSMGRSIIENISKEELFRSFTKWVGIEEDVRILPQDMIGMAIFKQDLVDS